MLLCMYCMYKLEHVVSNSLSMYTVAVCVILNM